jgi:hypothetical protein
MRVHLDRIFATILLSATLLAGAANIVAAPLTPQNLTGVENGASFLGISCTYRGVYLEESDALSCVGRPRHVKRPGYWYPGYSVSCYWYPDRPDCDWRYGWHWYPGHSPYSAWLSDPRR